MKLLLSISAGLAILSIASPLAAYEEPAEKAPANLSFLTPNHDYLIRFPPTYEMFTSKRSGVSPTTYTTADGQKREGKPTTWSMTVSVEVFHIIRFGGGSWVLVEYPAKGDDFIKWNAQRRAQAVLRDPSRIAGGDVKERSDRLTKLQQEAAEKIETDQIWINLDHAVAIAEVPNRDVPIRFKIQAVQPQPQRQ